eukprot:4447861-Prymnesium_polylepis.1
MGFPSMDAPIEENTSRRTTVEAKSYLFASNVEPGGSSNKTAFWVVQPAYGSCLPEPGGPDGSTAFIRTSTGLSAPLARSTVCKLAQRYDGHTEWELSFGK